jgi:hypothetical protein
MPLLHAAKIAARKALLQIFSFIGGILLPAVALVMAFFPDEQLIKEFPNCCRRMHQVARICGYCGHEFMSQQLFENARFSLPDAGEHV